MLNKIEELLNLNEHSIIKKSIQIINANLGNVINSISTIESDINDIQSDITSLQNTDVAINNSITSLNNSISSINNSISDLHDGLDALEAQVNTIILNGSVAFRSVNYTGVKDGVNTIFSLSSHVDNISIILNGLELVENVHYNYNVSTNIVTIVDLVSIPNASDYFIIKGNY